MLLSVDPSTSGTSTDEDSVRGAVTGTAGDAVLTFMAVSGQNTMLPCYQNVCVGISNCCGCQLCAIGLELHNRRCGRRVKWNAIPKRHETS